MTNLVKIALIIGVSSSALVGGTLYAKVQNLKNTPAVLSQQTSAPVAEIPVSTVDPDPVVNCIFSHTGTRRMKTSDCKLATDCQIGSSWIWYASMDACKSAQQAFNTNQTQTNQQPSVNQINQKTASGLITCNVYYPTTKITYTYQVTPADCIFYQQAASNIKSTTYVAPAPYILPPMPTTDPNLVNNAINQMNQAVNNIPQVGPLVPLGSTPIPCSSLQGEANISQVNCQ